MSLVTSSESRLITHRPAAAPAIWWLSGGISAANCIAAYAPKGAASLAASYVNLANPGTYTAAPGSAPTWDTSTGWTFNGSSQYLTTGIVPGSGYSVIVRYSGGNTSGATRTLIGVVQLSPATSRLYVQSHETSATKRGFGYGNNAFNGTGASAAAGVIALTPANGYFNGVSDLTVTSSWVTISTLALWIGASNRAGGLDTPFAGNMQAMAIYNVNINSYISALTIAMNAL